MHRVRLAVVTLMAMAAIGTAIGCSDSGTGPGGGAVDLTGTYDLVSLTFGLPTTAGGLMVMSSSTFADSIHVTSPADTVILLAGTYVTKGSDSIYLTPPSPFPQIPGTFRRNAAKDTLALNLSFSGTALATVWHKR
jgi:hypothetical protein